MRTGPAGVACRSLPHKARSWQAKAIHEAAEAPDEPPRTDATTEMGTRQAVFESPCPGNTIDPLLVSLLLSLALLRPPSPSLAWLASLAFFASFVAFGSCAFLTSLASVVSFTCFASFSPAAARRPRTSTKRPICAPQIPSSWCAAVPAPISEVPYFGTSLPFNIISTGTIGNSLVSYYVWAHDKHTSSRIRRSLQLNLLVVIILVQGVAMFSCYLQWKVYHTITWDTLVKYNTIIGLGLVAPEARDASACRGRVLLGVVVGW